MCHALYQDKKALPYGLAIAAEFPEFALMAPSEITLLCGDAWFNSDLYVGAFGASNIPSRLTILAFCIAMCEE